MIITNDRDTTTRNLIHQWRLAAAGAAASRSIRPEPLGAVLARRASVFAAVQFLEVLVQDPVLQLLADWLTGDLVVLTPEVAPRLVGCEQHPVGADAAFQRECAGFDAAYRQIQQVSSGGHIDVARLEKLTAHSMPGWSSRLLAAARAARAPGVPRGPNRAWGLAVAIDKVANAVLILEVDATIHRAAIINRDWSRVQAQVAAVRAAGCS